MDILCYLSIFCLSIFMMLAVYDGIYLHLWKYELFNHKESYFEHLIHTLRAILFAVILWLLFSCPSKTCFIIGLFFFVLDLFVLGLDAYAESGSRQFMGGLPKWEYIIHLFANSLHFRSFVMIISIRLSIVENQLIYTTDFLDLDSFGAVQFYVRLILPGAVVIALLHIVFLLGRSDVAN